MGGREDRTADETHRILRQRVWEVFAEDAAGISSMTLRGGNAIDSYDEPLPFSAEHDAITDEYLKGNAWGIPHLDPASWRHYLPSLIDFALRHFDGDESLVTDSVLNSLRPPDREPPRLATLTRPQEEVIVAFLDIFAFDERSVCKEEAMQVLEEYWIPGALYRRK